MPSAKLQLNLAKHLFAICLLRCRTDNLSAPFDIRLSLTSDTFECCEKSHTFACMLSTSNCRRLHCTAAAAATATATATTTTIIIKQLTQIVK